MYLQAKLYYQEFRISWSGYHLLKKYNLNKELSCSFIDDEENLRISLGGFFVCDTPIFLLPH